MTRFPAREAGAATHTDAAPDILPLDRAIVRLRESVMHRDARPSAPRTLTRVARRVEAVDAASWLAAQPSGSRVFWRDRAGGHVRAGLGIAWRITGSSIDALLASAAPWLAAHPDVTAFATARFDTGRAPDTEWAPFGDAALCVPAVELSVRGGVACVAAYVAAEGDAAADVLAALRPPRSRVTGVPGVVEDVTATPCTDAWSDAVGALLDRIAGGTLRKAVLSRAVDVVLDETADGGALIAALAETSPGAFVYLVESGPAAFVGASPELLYRRTADVIASEALAGTRPRGETPTDDDRLARELVSSDKERREHAFVLEHVHAALSSVCAERVHVGPREVRRLGTVQHLAARVSGTRRPGTTDAEVIGALHPTPAVCGLPREHAREVLRALEPFDRGLYGGPIGLVSRDEVTLAVALRCARLHGARARLFAGAGIVEGSIAEREWTETAAKLRALADALDPSP